MIFLVDECLHTSLVETAREAHHEAHHVVYLGMQGWKDPEVLQRVGERDYTLVTNNAVDFRRLYAKMPIHAGLVIIVPNVTPALQRELFRAALMSIGASELVNTVVEVSIENNNISVVRYGLPRGAR
jgi:predicted nuclease of predicted toxin-antitoxin system